MTIIRWEPAAELGTIQNEMNRLFNTFFDQSVPTGRGVRPQRWIPAIDLVEGDEHYLLYADLPGMSEQDVSVQMEDDVLTISGERRLAREQGREGYRRLERATGMFARSLTLPEGIDPDAITASFEHGVLEVRIPKPEQKKPRKVQISVGGSDGRTIKAGAVDSGAITGAPRGASESSPADERVPALA